MVDGTRITLACSCLRLPFFLFNVKCDLAAQYAMDRGKDVVEMVSRMMERITLSVAAAAAALPCPLGSCSKSPPAAGGS